jgi:hypothetical protein
MDKSKWRYVKFAKNCKMSTNCYTGYNTQRLLYSIRVSVPKMLARRWGYVEFFNNYIFEIRYLLTKTDFTNGSDIKIAARQAQEF